MVTLRNIYKYLTPSYWKGAEARKLTVPSDSSASRFFYSDEHGQTRYDDPTREDPLFRDGLQEADLERFIKESDYNNL